MDCHVLGLKVVGKIMDLCMAIVTRGNAVISSCSYNLVKLDLAIGITLICESRLEKASASATTVVVRLVGPHINKIFFPHNGLHHKPKIVCHRISVSLAYNLTRILNRKLDLPILVPVRVDLELSFPNPLGIILVDASNFEVIRDIEFSQSFQD